MLNKIKSLIISLSMISMFAMPMLAPASASAATFDPKSNLCSGSNFDLSGKTTNCSDTAGGAKGLGPKIAGFINIFSAIVGIAAVIMIIYAGFRYVTSAGSQDAVKSAKDAIIYAIVGLVVVALAQAIVRFVINNLS